MRWRGPVPWPEGLIVVLLVFVVLLITPFENPLVEGLFAALAALVGIPLAHWVAKKRRRP